jgi:murein L,D-transpeptidase YafK
MRSGIVLLLLSLHLYATQIATIYREKGMDAVRVALDARLTQSSYWEEEIKRFDTSFGYFENLTSIITCNKERSKLYHYQLKDGSYQLSHTFGAITGKVDGDKQAEGDHRTPLGIYTLTKKIVNPDPFYGPLAYVTSYPNLYDRVRGKNGSGIWIHGLPLEGERDTFTKGCIAIENEDICALDETLSLDDTLLIIDQENHREMRKKELSIILAKLFQWRYAWLYNDYDRYIDFYDPSFIRFDGMQYEAFKKYKRNVFDYNDTKEIDFSNIKIIPYPGEDANLFMISFYESYRSKRITFNGEKNLIIRYENNSIVIIAER